ncbi:MAG: hypothetical protein ACKOAU_18325 [Pirellula sp.]
MIQRAYFVNCPATVGIPVAPLGVLVFLWLCLLACAQESLQESLLQAQGTEYYRQAVEKLGPPSRIVWSEPGDNSLERWKPRSLIEVKAVIVSWDIDKLVVAKVDGNGPTTFPGDLVVGIEPAWKSPVYEQTMVLIKQRRLREALQQGQTALALSEIPRWQQRVLVAEMVDAALALQQIGVAGKIFKVLAQDSAPELLMSRIPIPWSDELITVTPAVTQEALGWIESPIPAMQLLGASWLLGGEHRLAAIEKLKALAASETVWIAEYSKVQLWRLSMPEEVASEKFLVWVGQRDALPIPLQAGPTMLLAHRLDQANQPKLAIAEWLRVASLHEDRYHLVQQATRRATEIADKIGDPKFAESIVKSFSSLKESSPESLRKD